MTLGYVAAAIDANRHARAVGISGSREHHAVSESQTSHSDITRPIAPPDGLAGIGIVAARLVATGNDQLRLVAVGDEQRRYVRNAFVAWRSLPAHVPRALVQGEQRSLAFLAAIEDDQVLVDDGRVAVAMLAIKTQRLHSPKLFPVQIETAQVHAVSDLKRCDDARAVGGRS